ncbi:MAG: hypothetical protein WAX04_12810 [Oscillospiraceae bacterium]
MNEQEILNQSQATPEVQEAPVMPNMTMAPAPVDKKGSAIAGFVLGIVSLLVCLVPLFGVPCTIVGIVMSAKGMKSTKKTLAIIGLVFCIIGLIVTIISAVMGAIAGAKIAQQILSMQ